MTPRALLFSVCFAIACGLVCGPTAIAQDTDASGLKRLGTERHSKNTSEPSVSSRNNRGPGKSSVADFTAHNIVHVLYHEAGHAVIDQFKLAVIGQEEDAADSFATYSIAELYDDPIDILVDAAEAMFISHQVYGVDRSDYFGEHDLDIQRAFRIMCHAYGLDPKANARAARQVRLDPDQKYVCERDATVMRDSWDALLEDSIPYEDEPAATVNVAVADTREYTWERNLILNHPLIDEFILDMEDGFRWPAPLSVVFAECDEVNAFYDPDRVEITMCYEFVQEMAAYAKARK